MSDEIVRLRMGGVLFDVEKSTLLRIKGTYFHGLLSSGVWHPDVDGAYSIDRSAMGFDRILEYLRSGILSVEGLSVQEEKCVYSNLDYFLVPYYRHYRNQSVIEGFRVRYVFQLKDDRLCGAYENDIIVWNMDSSSIAMSMKGHIDHILQVIQLHDGRVCSCSDDSTIKLWSVDSGLCERTLTGHTIGVSCIIQLFDGRLCSDCEDNTIRVWNILTGVCEMAIHTLSSVRCIVQLTDGRICCCDYSCSISIYCSVTGECELSWKRHSMVYAISCIDSARICSGSDDRTIKVWNTATGECERTLEGHTDYVTSIVLMQDGRLCSASYDGTLKLWNLDTGECEVTLRNLRGYYQTSVVQLSDGSLLSFSNFSSNSLVGIWS